MSDSTEKQLPKCKNGLCYDLALPGREYCADHAYLATPPSGDKPCPTCGATNFPVWNDKGECITCARDRVLGKAPQAPNRETPAHDELDVLEAIVKHARPEGDQEDGDFVGFYILPTGPIHRAISLLQRHGRFSTPSGGLIARYDALIEREKAQAVEDTWKLAEAHERYAVNEGRLIELDLLEQAINQGRDMNEYKLYRLAELTPDPTNKEEE